MRKLHKPKNNTRLHNLFIVPFVIIFISMLIGFAFSLFFVFVLSYNPLQSPQMVQTNINQFGSFINSSIKQIILLYTLFGFIFGAIVASVKVYIFFKSVRKNKYL